MLFTALKRLGIGVLYGAGFGVGLLAILFMFTGGLLPLWPTQGSEFGPAYSEVNPQRVPGRLNEQLVFESKPASTTNFGTLAVPGSVENKGDAISGYVNVYADFFEADGSFLYQCMHQFSDGIAAGAKENFVIECHGMNRELASKYASHKLHARPMR
jgi:hypothetical protein